MTPEPAAPRAGAGASVPSRVARRVVYVSDARYEGGAERYLLRLAASLDRTRFEPVVLLPDRGVLDALAGRFQAARVPVHRYRRPEGVGPQGPLSMLRALARLRPGLVHLNLPSPYELGCGGWALAARMAGARRVVATEHIADIAPSRRRVLQKRLWAGAIDRVLTISQTHRELLVSRHGVPRERITVIENGVEDPGPPETRSTPPIRIACVGLLEERKGQDLLVRAVAGLRRRGLPVTLALVGEGPLRARLESMIQAEGLASCVTLTGALPSAGAEMARAHLLALPSRIEGLPFVLLEAMAAGAALAASDLPGVGEVVDPGVGLLLPAGDAAAWEAGLAGLVADPERLRRMGEAARRKFLERFTLERMVAGTSRAYDEVPG